MSCTTRLPMCGCSPSVGPPRSRRRPASRCTAARCVQARAESVQRCLAGPRLSCSAAGSLGMLLALSRIPVTARALTAPGMAGRLVLPHSFRVTGVFFLLYLALGHLPALFALPAGLGDIAAGIAAVLVALRLAQGTGRRAAVWFNAYGLTDLAVGITLGALTSYGLLHVTPSTAPISQLP